MGKDGNLAVCKVILELGKWQVVWGKAWVDGREQAWKHIDLRPEAWALIKWICGICTQQFSGLISLWPNIQSVFSASASLTVGSRYLPPPTPCTQPPNTPCWYGLMLSVLQRAAGNWPSQSTVSFLWAAVPQNPAAHLTASTNKKRYQLAWHTQGETQCYLSHWRLLWMIYVWLEMVGAERRRRSHPTPSHLHTHTHCVPLLWAASSRQQTAHSLWLSLKASRCSGLCLIPRCFDTFSWKWWTPFKLKWWIPEPVFVWMDIPGLLSHCEQPTPTHTVRGNSILSFPTCMILVGMGSPVLIPDFSFSELCIPGCISLATPKVSSLPSFWVEALLVQDNVLRQMLHMGTDSHELISMCGWAIHTQDAPCGSSEMVHELRFSTGIENMYENTCSYMKLHVIKHNSG